MKPVTIALAGLVVLLAGARDLRSEQLGGWRTTGPLVTWHSDDVGGYGPTATLLNNGTVLVVSGAGAELYIPETGEWISTGKLITPRYGHVAVRLPNGKVLVAGGINLKSYDLLGDTEIYDPSTGAWSPAASLSVPRMGHTAHLLTDGTVLVIGGVSYGRECCWVTLSSVESYDPTTGAWTPAARLPLPYVHHASTLLPNGNVLVIGGREFGRTRPEVALFDLATRTWKPTGNLITPRADPTATLLPDGKVLVAGGGGENLCSDPEADLLCALDAAELYDPLTGQWSATGSMTERRSNHTATLLPGGKVLVAGGRMGNQGHVFYDRNLDRLTPVSDTAELYDPVTAQWMPTANMNAFRYGHTGTLLANGKVLVAAGWVFGGDRNAAELYDQESPLLNVKSASYCIGTSWELTIKSLAPRSWIRLAGTSDGKAWEILDWRKTDENGYYSEIASFTPGSEGAHTLYADIAGKISNQVSFTVARCEIQLTLNSNEYCTGTAWNLKIASDFQNAWMTLSGTTNNTPWEVANWRRTGGDGSFSETGAFVPGSEGDHTMRVRIGAAQSNTFAFRVTRCGP